MRAPPPRSGGPALPGRLLALATLLLGACAVGGGSADTGRGSPDPGEPGDPAPMGDGGGGWAPDRDGGVAADGGGGGGDAPVRPPDVPGDGFHDYVLRLMDVGEETGTGEVPGFDLDGHVTAGAGDRVGCGHPDGRAPARFGGHDGVDSRIGALVEEAVAVAPELDLDAALEEAIQEGRTLLLVRLVDAGDLVDDGSVEVRIYLGRLEGGGGPALETATVGGEARTVLAGGQTFAIDARSIRGGDPSSPLVHFPDSYIAGGRLYAGPAPFHVDVETGDTTLPLALEQARLAFDVAPDRLANGLVGAHLDVATLTTAIVTAADDPSITEGLVGTVLDSHADIDTDGAGGCEALSLSFVFDATTATIDGVL